MVLISSKAFPEHIDKTAQKDTWCLGSQQLLKPFNTGHSHNAATFLRKEFGLETARIILGHRSAVITEVYTELDQQKAIEAIVRVG